MNQSEIEPKDRDQRMGRQPEGDSVEAGKLSTADLAYGKRDGAEVSSNTEHEGLIPQDASSTFQGRWSEIQTRFVDEPQDSVREADGLVTEVIQRLAQRFADERQQLEGQWQGGGKVSTEDLRLALQHYRSFFQRLLAA